MKLPKPSHFERFNGKLVGLYSHDQLIQALKDWGEECALVCDEHVKCATSTDGEEWSESCATAIREKSKELDK